MTRCEKPNNHALHLWPCVLSLWILSPHLPFFPDRWRCAICCQTSPSWPRPRVDNVCHCGVCEASLINATGEYDALGNIHNNHAFINCNWECNKWLNLALNLQQDPRLYLPVCLLRLMLAKACPLSGHPLSAAFSVHIRACFDADAIYSAIS